MCKSKASEVKRSVRVYSAKEKELKAKLGFAIHLSVFGLISSGHFVSGLFTGQPFAVLTMFWGWGIGLFFHAFAVLIQPRIKDYLRAATADFQDSAQADAGNS